MIAITFCNLKVRKFSILPVVPLDFVTYAKNRPFLVFVTTTKSFDFMSSTRQSLCVAKIENLKFNWVQFCFGDMKVMGALSSQKKKKYTDLTVALINETFKLRIEDA